MDALTLTKRMEKKLNGNYTRMLRAILNRSRGQHPTKQLLYSHLPPIRKTIQVRRTRHAGHCWRSGDGLIGDILLWNPSHGWAKAGRPARTYIQKLCADTGYSLEDLPGARDDKERSLLAVRHDDDDLNECKQMTDVKLLLLHRNTWNLLTVCKNMRSGSFKNVMYKMCLQIIYLIYNYK